MTFDKRCLGTGLVQDNVYTTSATIAYLGENEEIKGVFRGLVNKVYTRTCSHNDLVYTLMDLMSKFNGSPLVTSRQGRNLFDLARGADLKHISIRNTQFDMEIAIGDDLIRTHTYSIKDGIRFRNIHYPTCVNNGSEMVPLDEETHRLSYQMLIYLNDLVYKNQVFNYGFRNTKCLERDSCAFPVPGPTYKSQILNQYFFVPFIKCGVILTVICLLQ